MWLIVVSILAVLITIALGSIVATVIWESKGKQNGRRNGRT